MNNCIQGDGGGLLLKNHTDDNRNVMMANTIFAENTVENGETHAGAEIYIFKWRIY